MTISDRMFNRFVLGAVAFGFLSLIVAVVAATWGTFRFQELNRWVGHTYEVELALSDFSSLSERVETARRGFLIQPDERFVQSFRFASERLPETTARIADLTKDNPRQEALVTSLRAASARQLGEASRSIEQRRREGAAAAQSAFMRDGSLDVVRELREIARQMRAEEQRLLAERRERQEKSADIALAILFVSGLLAVLVAVGTIWAIRRNLKDVQTTRDVLQDLNDNLEAAVATRTSDLQRANEEIQRFAYIVSHDLRSPLVNVMGFTSELDAATRPLADLIERAERDAPDIVTEEARLAVREDLPESIGFIRSSTQKMDRLINAILRLSREGRRVITPEPLDLTEMLNGIVGSLQHRLTEVGADIEVDPALPPLVSDRVAIEQIFSNLVENAVKYLKPGVPGHIVVRGRREGTRLVYEVEDNGRGIDPKDHERIFDLFRRSGQQDQPGEGIGLAHVRALAYRLGGIIDCRSSLGEGATFRLSMPYQFQAAKEPRQ